MGFLIMGSETNLTNMFSWISTVNWLNLFLAVIVIGAGILVSYVIRKIVYRVTLRVMPANIAFNIARVIYYVLVILFTISGLSILGINLSGLLVAGGFLGVILGFALQSITANLVSGLFLYWERPLKPGDIVKIDEYYGVVLDISVISTKIKSFDGLLIRIPNEKVFTSVIQNIGASTIRRLDFRVGIAYREDAEKAIQVIRKILDKHPFILAIPEPEVFVEELGDSSVNILVRVWVPVTEWYEVKKQVLWEIKKAITEAGIEIPFPQHDIWFRNRVEVKLVK